MGTGERPSTSENDTLTDGWLSPPPPETEPTPTTPDLGTKDPQAPTTVSNSGDAATTTAIARVIVTDEPLKPAAQPQQPVQPKASLLIDPAAQRPPTGKGDTLRMKPASVVEALQVGTPPTSSDPSTSTGPRNTVRTTSPWSKKPAPAVAQSEAPQPSKPARNPLQGAKTVLRIIPHAGKPPETTPNEKPASDKIPKNPILRTRTAVAIAAIAALTTVLYAERKAFETPSKPNTSATTPSTKVPNVIDAGTNSGTVTKQATPSASASQAPIDSPNVTPSVTPTTSATTTPKTKPPRTPIQRNPNAHTGDGDDNIHGVDVVNPWKK